MGRGNVPVDVGGNSVRCRYGHVFTCAGNRGTATSSMHTFAGWDVESADILCVRTFSIGHTLQDRPLDLLERHGSLDTLAVRPSSVSGYLQLVCSAADV